MAASDPATPLTPEDAYRRLRAHPGWVVERDRLRRDFRLRSFTEAVAFIDRVAVVAEHLGHHPNIRLHEWCFVELETYSHITGSLTTRDLDLVLGIDAMLAEDVPPA
jgi:4a-hydroxytetrahydrobiopterin dehydratase